MFKISYDKKITIVQGDTGVIKMKIHNYELSQGDEVRFAIINKATPSILLCQHSDKKIVLEKQVTVFEKDGGARIVIYPYDTENLQPGKYLYEIQVKTKDGRIDTVVPLTSFTLIEGSIQGEYSPTGPGAGIPGAGTNSSDVELRFKRLENEIIPELGTRINNVENETDSISSSLDNMKNNKLYVKDFGVKADGLADDTEALQNAIDWFKPKNTNELQDYQNCGGTIILPKGTIRITKTIRLYSNIKIVGTNKVLFGRESNDTLILLDTTDSKTPAFSFVGIDITTKKHKEALVVAGEDMDNGVVTQTWNTTLKDFTLKSKNINDLAINYTCAVKSKIENIAFENFDVDIFHSAGWDNQIINCNTLCNFSHLISQSGNSLLLKNVYVNPSTKIKSVLPMNHLLYEYVNVENLIYKNSPTGIINIGTHGLNIEKGIIEKIKIGIQSCVDCHESEKFLINTSFNKIHMEHVENAFVFKNVAALINGVYAYITPYTGEQVIECYNSHVTGINIQPVKYLDLYKADETSIVNFFGCNNKWQTKTELNNAEVGKTIFASWENEAIIKTWQEKFKTVVGENTVESQYADLKEVNTCEINTSKLIIHNPPESPVDVRYSNTVILDCSSPKTIYSFKARDFQEFSLIAIKGNISLNGNESGGLMNIKGGVIDPIPVGGVIKFICYNGVCYEISRSF